MERNQGTMMPQSAEFRKLEQKAYLSYHQDGLIDLITGAVIICMAISEAMDSSIWNMLALLLIFAYLPLKHRVTFPRLGYVKFNVTRRGVNMRVASAVVISVLVLSLIGMLVLLFSGRSSSSPLILAVRENPALLYALLGLIGFGLAGIVLGIPRLLVYALLSLVIMLGGHWLNLPLWSTLLLLGGTILATGAVLLIRFLRRYPSAEGENHDPQ
jgi:hypothetical protein